MSTLEKPQKPKTRWGCLAIPIAFTLLFAVARIHDEGRKEQADFNGGFPADE